jgi:hypothetical protein
MDAQFVGNPEGPEYIIPADGFVGIEAIILRQSRKRDRRKTGREQQYAHVHGNKNNQLRLLQLGFRA